MSTKEDSLFAGVNTDRVNYATGVLLNADDFVAEQNYHRGRLARALGYLHGFGTVSGLRVIYEPASSGSVVEFAAAGGEKSAIPSAGGVLGQPLGVVPLGENVSMAKRDSHETESSDSEEKITVLPGLAIDRYGRLIEVGKPYCLRLNRWFQSQNPEKLEDARHEGSVNAVVVDLFIRFVTCQHGKTPAFASGPFNALDAVTASRLRDHFELFTVLRPKSLPLPEPVPLWNDLADVTAESRREELKESILDSWREGTGSADDKGLDPLVEHTGVADTSSLLLARITIPATAGVGGGTGVDTPRPVRSEDPVEVENHLRHFIYGAGALAQWVDK